MRLFRRLRVTFALIAMLLAAGLAQRASAANFFWAGDNAAAGNNWSAVAGLGASNWSSSPIFNSSTGTTLPGAADNVFFYLLPTTSTPCSARISRSRR